MTYRLRNIVLAIALAAVAAMLTGFYAANVRKSARTAEETVPVFVAAKEIPSGTSGADAFERGLIRSEDVARRTVVPGAISDPAQVSDLVAVGPIYEGEQVSVRRFQAVEAAGVRAELEGNLRAMQVAGDATQLLAGTLRRGDRVDVVASIKYRVKDIASREEVDAVGDVERTASRVVLRDLLVLKAGDVGLAAEQVNTSNSYTVQLAVTDSQAQKLFFVTQNAAWSLQLRPVVDAEDSPESVETIESVLGDGLRPAQFQQLYSGRRSGQ